MRKLCFLAVALLALAPVGQADDPPLADQQERQRQIQADADRMVRRISAMLRVMDYYQLDKTAERKMLDDVAAQLGNLSREQMSAVLTKLEAAATEPDPAKAASELMAAYARHREVIVGLKKMLAGYDAVKTLDQAADRLDKLSREEVELALQSSAIWTMAKDPAEEALARVRRRATTTRTLAQRQAAEQTDFRKEVKALRDQMAGLRQALPADQRGRLDDVLAKLKSTDLVDRLQRPAEWLQTHLTPPDSAATYEKAVNDQWAYSANLLELSHALRVPRDRLAGLRDARAKLGQSLTQQEALAAETESVNIAPLDDEAKQRMREEEVLRRFRGDIRNRGSGFNDDDTPSGKARLLANKQGRIEHAVRDGRFVLQPHTAALAGKVETIEESLRSVQSPLRELEGKDAAGTQRQAVVALRTVLIELDRMILEAEKEKSDPLAALQRAIDTIDKIIDDQKLTHELTKAATQSDYRDHLEKLAKPQGELAQMTDALRQSPLPVKPETQAELAKASAEMSAAAKELKAREGKAADPKQESAVKSLEAAKRQLEEKASEVLKRRDELAKLEEAAKKVAELAEKEKGVADNAKALKADAKPDDAKPVADKQAAIAPPTQQVAKDVKDAAPDAAKHLDKASESMDAAKKALDNSKPMPKNAAENANDATRKLQDAHDALAKEIDAKKGEELADQARLQPNTIDPNRAAQEIAKAQELARQAEKESKKADPQKGAQAELAKVQKEVADKASEMKLDKVSDQAQRAAEALDQGDLTAATEAQKKALDKLQEAAKRESQAKESQPQGKTDSQSKGEPKGDGKSQGQQPSKLAEKQRALLDATQALAKSQTATQAARSAVAQAQATAPQGVQQQLNQASKDLQKASESLGQGQPGDATQAQGDAQKALGDALSALQAAQAAAKAQGHGQLSPGQQQGQQPGQAQQPGQQPGQGQPQPGQQPGKGEKPGQAREQNDSRATGDRKADGQTGNGSSMANGTKGDGAFLHLPPRQRELIKQALGDKLPPEYAASIQQYYVNIAKGKAATKPAPPEPPK